MSFGQRVKGDMDAQSSEATVWSPHGDELFGGPIINSILVEVHLTVNSKYPWTTQPVLMSHLPKVKSIDILDI